MNCNFSIIIQRQQYWKKNNAYFKLTSNKDKRTATTTTTHRRPMLQNNEVVNKDKNSSETMSVIYASVKGTALNIEHLHAGNKPTAFCRKDRAWYPGTYMYTYISMDIYTLYMHICVYVHACIYVYTYIDMIDNFSDS